MTIKDRVRKLETKIVKPFQFGTTKMLIEDPSERRLVDVCKRLISANIPFNELTREQRIILDKGFELVHQSS